MCVQNGGYIFSDSMYKLPLCSMYYVNNFISSHNAYQPQDPPPTFILLFYSQLNPPPSLNTHTFARIYAWATGSALVRVIGCRLLGARPLTKPKLTYCQSVLQKMNNKKLVKFESRYKVFHWWKCIWKYRLQNGGGFVQGRWVEVVPFFYNKQLTLPEKRNLI